MNTDETPLTDAHQNKEGMAHDWLWREFAQGLERQLNAANEKLKQCEQDVADLNQRLIERTRDMLARLAQFEAEYRKKLTAAEKDAESLALAIKEGGLPAAEHCKLNATFHIRTMKEALAAHEARKKKPTNNEHEN